MRWRLSSQCEPAAVALADAHYSRKTVGSSQFVPPGRRVVLLTLCQRAVWVSHWPQERYVKREIAPGAWVCTIFRNEGAGLSSELIREAIAATRWRWRRAPPDGMVTFVDASKVRPKRDPGRCFLRAGFVNAGTTRSGHIVLRISPEAMPEPDVPLHASFHLLEPTDG